MPVYYSERFAETLRRLIGERTQADVARAAGCDEATLSRMARAGRIPSRRMLGNVARVLELDEWSRAQLYAAAGYVELQQEPAP